MIRNVTIDGRPATASYLDNDMKPVATEAEASIVEIFFTDEQNGSIFLVPESHDHRGPK